MAHEHTMTTGPVHLFFRMIDGTAPAILLEAGGGADSSSWGALPERLARATGHRIVTYDRAGFGHTAFPAEGFTVGDEVEALHAGLHELGVDQIVMVAASYGALMSVAYVRAHPAGVTGLVLLDPMNADFVDAVGVARVIGTVPKIAAPANDKQRAIARMVERFPALIADLHGVRWPATLPAVIVSAATPPFPDPDLQAAWRASHQGLAHTPGATQVFAEHSDHDIAEAEPDVVIGVVQRILAVH